MTSIRAGAPATWTPIALTEEVQAEMDKEHPDVPWLRRWMLDNYAAQNGAQIRVEDATPAQLTNLVHWLAFQEANGGIGTLRRRWRWWSDCVLYQDYSVKVGAISQRYCSICSGGRPIDDLGILGRYMVRITPISRQASKRKKGMFKAFQAAFAERFSARPVDIGKTGRVCIALTFVLSTKKRDKDVDNMSKAVLDAFSRAVGFNDRFVHHLDVIKLRFPVTEEYIYIRVAPSALNEHADVVAPTFHQTWLGSQRIELADYMPALKKKQPPLDI